ncbi:DUF1294 domain-containing protein [Fusibacter sp. JL298sf-3]
MNTLQWSIVVGAVVLNLVGFALMAVDKWKAKHNKWRISEAMLILPALFGGAVGSATGMIVFHHKISKPKFRTVIPLCLWAYLGLVLYMVIRWL